ncbi:MAG: M1 family metallopeptidase [bacterium]
MKISRRVSLPLFLGSLLILASAPPSASQQLPSGVAVEEPSFRPTASYRMDVTLDPSTHTVSGWEVLTFRNSTSRPVRTLRFHAYYNAWKTDASTWMRRSGRTLPEEVGKDRLAWIQVTGARVEPNMFFPGEDVLESFTYIQPDDGNPWDQTLFEVELPRPLPAGGEVVIRLDFTSKVPRTFARTGYIGDHYFLAQWFPKVGVLTEQGWEAHQYFPVEYFADYGTYDVSITVPSEYVVGATGERAARRDTHADGTTTHRFRQEMVHDFAWTAWPEYLVYVEDYEFLPGHSTEITLLLTPEHRGLKERYLQATRYALHYFSDWFGPYPYTTCTVVDPPYNSGAGGMEYPTFFTGGAPLFPARGVMRPEGVTIHEFGHQFWYGLVGNNETVDAWMDEGFTSYSESRVQKVAYGPASNHEEVRVFGLPVTLWEAAVPFEWAAAPRYRAHARSKAMDVPSYLQGAPYGALAYSKPELMHWTLEGYLGWETWREVLAVYHMRYRYRHPFPQDFFRTAEEVAGRDLDWFFDQVYRTAGVLDYAVDPVEDRRLRAPRGSLGPPPYAPEGGPPWTPAEAPRPEGDLWESEVTVRRLGEVHIPVEVLVVFEDGEEVIERWDGTDRSRLFTYRRPARVARVVADPEEKLVLDVERMNNSWQREADRRGLWKLLIRLLTWIQTILEFFAFTA